MEAFAPPETDTDPPDRFPTKTGWCIVRDDRLSIRREGARGALASVLLGNSVRRASWVPRLLAIVLGIAGVVALSKPGGACLGAPTVLFSGWLFWMTLRDRALSLANEILFERLRRIEAHPAVPGVTRAHFKIWFEDEAGRERVRFLLLPGALQGGPQAFEKAKRLLRERDLPVLAQGTRTPPPRRQ